MLGIVLGTRTQRKQKEGIQRGMSQEHLSQGLMDPGEYAVWVNQTSGSLVSQKVDSGDRQGTDRGDKEEK